MRNTANLTGGNPIAVLLQSISGVSAFKPLIAFTDIHGEKRGANILLFVPDTTRDINIYNDRDSNITRIIYNYPESITQALQVPLTT
jgi:hypothetical protein